MTFEGDLYFTDSQLVDLKYYHDLDINKCRIFKDSQSDDCCLRPVGKLPSDHRNPASDTFGHSKTLNPYKTAYAVENESIPSAKYIKNEKLHLVHHCKVPRDRNKGQNVNKKPKCLNGKHVSYRTKQYNDSMNPCFEYIRDFYWNYYKHPDVNTKCKLTVPKCNAFLRKLGLAQNKKLYRCPHPKTRCFIIYGPHQ